MQPRNPTVLTFALSKLNTQHFLSFNVLINVINVYAAYYLIIDYRN